MNPPRLQPGDLEAGAIFYLPTPAHWLEEGVRDRLIANGKMRMWADNRHEGRMTRAGKLSSRGCLIEIIPDGYWDTEEGA